MERWIYLSVAFIVAATGYSIQSSPRQRDADGEIAILARNHSARSGNIDPANAMFDGLSVSNGTNGMQKWTFSLKKPEKLFLHAYYTAKESRPVKLSINGEEKKGNFFAKRTGSWKRNGLTWETVGPFDFKSGNNTIRINAEGVMPHFGGWVLSSGKDTWNRNTFKGIFLTKEEVQAKSIAEMCSKVRETQDSIREKWGLNEIVFIKRVPYSSTHYYSEFIDSQWTPGGGIFVLSLKDGKIRQIAKELKGGVFGRFDISFDAKRIVFDWKRRQNEGYRIYEAGIAPEDQREAGGPGARLVLAPPKNEAALVRKYQVHRYHHGTDDMHPCYLPDGGIAFVSTRCQTSTLCHGGDFFSTVVMFRVERDGTGLKQLSFGALSEFTPVVAPDGRVLYARWEYVDKGAVSAKCIWAMRPDGTMSNEIYGNDISIPTTMTQPRAIPGIPNRYVILGCPQCPQSGLGTVIRLDMNMPIRTSEPISYMTPSVKILKEGGWHFFDLNTAEPVEDRYGNGPLFRDPWPLDWNRFLVAHKPRGFGPRYTHNGYGLYLLDSTGKVSPFYIDRGISCWQPVPLEPRPVPPILRSSINPALAAKKMAECVVQDIYHGLEDTKRGTIKYIRILEQVARPWTVRHPYGRYDEEYDQQYAVVSKDTALGLKVQHGIVPVEADGSARFLVPANANIFFQALDKNCLAVQTERTFVNFMPGETRSCIGCHETPKDVPLSPRSLMAMKRPASVPGPQPGEASARRALHYPSDVQPVLDRHCVSCHNGN